MIRVTISAAASATALALTPFAVAGPMLTSAPTAAEIDDRAAMLADRLSVTDDQRAAVEQILQETAEKRAAIMASFGFSDGVTPDLSRRQKRDLRSQMKDLSSTTTEKLDAVLTDEQMTVYAEIQKEQQDAMRARLQK